MRGTSSIFFVVGASLLVGCGGSGDAGTGATTGGDDAAKAALTKVAETLKEPLALIAGYKAFIVPPDTKDKYVPKRRPVYDRSAAAASNEIRAAANDARQKIPSTAGPVGADITKALNDTAGACADAADDDAFKKCVDAVNALDDALGKAQTASGVNFGKVATAAPTDASKKTVGRLEKAKGPGPAEKVFFEKRADPSASAKDVIAACQTAAAEVDAVWNQYEKAEAPIHDTAIVHKQNIDAQCHRMEGLGDLQTTVTECKKSPKKPDCITACGKAKAEIEEGVPAAAFETLTKAVADSCK
jgi:hypothetical protein